MNDQLYRKHNSKYINMFKISPSSPRSSATNATDCNQCLHQATITGEIHCPAQLPMTIETNYPVVVCFMDYDNWVGRTRTFDRDDPSFWGGFTSIPAFIGRCSPLTKLKMTASSIQRDWYFTSLTPFCSIWRDLYGSHLCIYKGNKSATQNMTKWLSTIGVFFTPAFRVEDGAICEKFYFQEGMTCQ